MSLNCLICMSTPDGFGFAELRVNSLHQLALIMPAPVVTYAIRSQVESSGHAQVSDAELFDLLIGVIRDIGRQFAHDNADGAGSSGQQPARSSTLEG